MSMGYGVNCVIGGVGRDQIISVAIVRVKRGTIQQLP